MARHSGAEDCLQHDTDRGVGAKSCCRDAIQPWRWRVIAMLSLAGPSIGNRLNDVPRSAAGNALGAWEACVDLYGVGGRIKQSRQRLERLVGLRLT